MKERPILMSAPMVRAILDGRKTQTRRVVKEKPNKITDLEDLGNSRFRFSGDAPTNYDGEVQMNDWSFDVVCPHGQPGSKLWVRETWAEIPDDGGTYVYRATDPDWESTEGWKWRPSIFMPRCASRITLEIESVRVERVQDISDKDAKAEGCCGVSSTCFGVPNFRWLWDSINLDRGFGWAVNPWVWVLAFRRVET